MDQVETMHFEGQDSEEEEEEDSNQYGHPVGSDLLLRNSVSDGRCCAALRCPTTASKRRRKRMCYAWALVIALAGAIAILAVGLSQTAFINWSPPPDLGWTSDTFTASFSNPDGRMSHALVDWPNRHVRFDWNGNDETFHATFVDLSQTPCIQINLDMYTRTGTWCTILDTCNASMVLEPLTSQVILNNPVGGQMQELLTWGDAEPKCWMLRDEATDTPFELGTGVYSANNSSNRIQVAFYQALVSGDSATYLDWDGALLAAGCGQVPRPPILQTHVPKWLLDSLHLRCPTLPSGQPIAALAEFLTGKKHGTLARFLCLAKMLHLLHHGSKQSVRHWHETCTVE